MQFLQNVADAIGKVFSGLISLWESEPVAITGLVTVLIDAAIAFGAPISPDQKTALVAVVSAIGVLIARGQVTPTSKI